MGKSGKKVNSSAKKELPSKTISRSVVKAKDKKKKSVKKLTKEKLQDDIENANIQFTDLQTKLVWEKEDQRENERKEKSKGLEKISMSFVSYDKQLEQTTEVFGNL
ncbi:uncharacterized protein LOC124437108 [Xenia sp. Carnegie-2017]|uniref:uncharacterized protein LOC124437108 n=1 Tax=Xenia sp. Carnegie-2017 TaxID=2897299 RepID=UPI001F04AE65|nr:uncharacterized protein LOC124437108 [Xenia sp. Carnegie-2017]